MRIIGKTTMTCQRMSYVLSTVYGLNWTCILFNGRYARKTTLNIRNYADYTTTVISSRRGKRYAKP